jgi:carbon storage regulator
MLVLSRKKGESVIINGNITVTIVEVRGDRIRLGIECPKEIPVYREEVFKLIKEREESGQP